MKLEDLRSQIGFVSQDPFLFDASVRENLLLAAPTAADDELEKALRVAHAWDFVNLLPEGWDTLIGERGVRLSMGEKQRLTLARAMLKSPPVIILDEATSSVDVETEKGIQRALAKLTRNKTETPIGSFSCRTEKSSNEETMTSFFPLAGPMRNFANTSKTSSWRAQEQASPPCGQ